VALCLVRHDTAGVIDPSLYLFLDRLGGPILAWIAGFSLWTVAKTLLRWAGRPVRVSKHMILTELPGLPLMLLHTVGFVAALRAGDGLSTLLFSWWGPGYLVVVALVLTRGSRLDWTPWGGLTSWGCKLSYVLLMGVFAWQELWTLPFAFSVWIMSDQVRLAWFDGNADRTRRTGEDLWLPRALYPGLLLLPLFVPVAGGAWAGSLGVVVLALWVGGIARTVRAGTFWQRPDPRRSHNLRDIVYLRADRTPPLAAPG
jgi:hypothetical protein